MRKSQIITLTSTIHYYSCDKATEAVYRKYYVAVSRRYFCNFVKEEITTQAFSCGSFQIIKNTFFDRTQPVATSETIPQRSYSQIIFTTYQIIKLAAIKTAIKKLQDLWLLLAKMKNFRDQSNNCRRRYDLFLAKSTFFFNFFAGSQI